MHDASEMFAQNSLLRVFFFFFLNNIQNAKTRFKMRGAQKFPQPAHLTPRGVKMKMQKGRY